MNDDKKSVEEILPEDKKHILDDMSDHLKSPLHDIGTKKTLQDKASEKE